MKITIKWTAFQTVLDNEFADDLSRQGKVGNAEMTFVFPTATPVADEIVLDYLFECTNLYQGRVWTEYLEGKMPANRSHTALSVGDQVVLDGREYTCESVGWKEVKTRQPVSK